MNRLCLDIGTQKFAAIEVDEDGKLIKHAMERHRFSLLKDGQVENVPAAAKELRNFLEKYDFDLRLPAIIAVAGKSMVVKTIEARKRIPSDFVSENDVTSLLQEVTQRASLEGYLLSDFDIAQWTLDDMIVDNPVGRHGQMLTAKIVMQFFRKDTVLSLINTVTQAGLSIVSIFSEAVASKEASIRQELRYFNIALVDVGAGTSDITIFKEGKVYNFASLNMAGNYITESIARKFMIPIETAEKIKTKQGKNRSVKNIVGKTVSVNEEELLNTIYNSTSVLASSLAAKIIEANDGRAPSAVALVGGGSLTPKLDEFLAQALEIPADMVHVAKLLGKGELSKPTWAVALGLAFLEPRNNVIRLLVDNHNVYFLASENPTLQMALTRSGINLERVWNRKLVPLKVMIGNQLEEFSAYEQNVVVPYLNGAAASWNNPISDGDVIEIHSNEKELAMDLFVTVEGITNERVPLSLVDQDGKVVEQPNSGTIYKIYPGTKEELESILSKQEQTVVRLKGPRFVSPGTHYKKVEDGFVNVKIGDQGPIQVPVSTEETLADLLAYLVDMGVLEEKPMYVTDGKREIAYSEPIINTLEIFIIYDKSRG